MKTIAINYAVIIRSLIALSALAICFSLTSASVHAEPNDTVADETTEKKSTAANGTATTLSPPERLRAKRANARQILLLAREYTRESKHRRVANTKKTPDHFHDRYIIDSLSRRLRVLLDEIAALEKALVEENPTSSTETQDGPPRGRNNLSRFVADLGYAKPDRPSAIKKFFWPLEGTILSSPGTSIRRGGARWPGIFIESTPGATVRAISAGKVVYAGEMKQLGLLVILDHEDGHLSLYGKNAKIFVETNQYIDENQPIAVIDNETSAQSGDFYFEIRRDGKPIDPRIVCSTRADISSQNDGR